MRPVTTTRFKQPLLFVLLLTLLSSTRAGRIVRLQEQDSSFPTMQLFSPRSTTGDSLSTTTKTTKTWPTITSSAYLTTPFTALSTFTSPAWTTVPVAWMDDPFCVNEADPRHGVGNHCVCKNGATIDVIPVPSHTGNGSNNWSDYQPCAYSTVEDLPSMVLHSDVPTNSWKDNNNNNNNSSSSSSNSSMTGFSFTSPSSFYGVLRGRHVAPSSTMEMAMAAVGRKGGDGGDSNAIVIMETTTVVETTTNAVVVTGTNAVTVTDLTVVTVFPDCITTTTTIVVETGGK
ncbi:hypothetical protein B0H66DRAFT_589785 [Apodospora peruviana]|uniref:Membrane-associated protein n=1 Tax=Apodospora peruviana TaxID=516989 RepID=A0AAE0IB86_9PEZI|nr:hypothetical protein B0H66DRAFT_589785 [Apodospora peruviana]